MSEHGGAARAGTHGWRGLPRGLGCRGGCGVATAVAAAAATATAAGVGRGWWRWRRWMRPNECAAAVSMAVDSLRMEGAHAATRSVSAPRYDSCGTWSSDETGILARPRSPAGVAHLPQTPAETGQTCRVVQILGTSALKSMTSSQRYF